MAKGTRDEGYYWAAVHKEKKMGSIVAELRDGKNKIVEDKEEPVAAGSAAGVGQQSLAIFNKDPDSGLKVIVDSRERNSTILKVLREKCEIELKQLPVGDYLVSDRVCVERKSMGDFLQSIVDQRLMTQAAEMRRNFQIPVILLEGVDELYAQRNIHPNAIRGVMASLAVNFDIPIIPTEDEEDTAQMIIALAKREQEDNRRSVGLRGGKKPELLKEKQRYIVESLPNVSAVLADRLLKKFGSVESVVNATQTKLKEVEGIGEKKAADIRKVVKGRYKKE